MTTHEIIELLLRRLDRLESMLTDMDDKLDAHIERENSLQPALEEMAEMWGRSKAVAWFFTKLASMIAILAGAWTWAKDHIK